MKNRKKIIELLKSGNFTLYYYDNGSCSLYKGKNINFEEDNFNEKPIYEFDCEFEGYLPKEVQLLVEALEGKSDSI